jgi:Inner centromere protein, ARK binding region
MSSNEIKEDAEDGEIESKSMDKNNVVDILQSEELSEELNVLDSKEINVHDTAISKTNGLIVPSSTLTELETQIVHDTKKVDLSSSAMKSTINESNLLLQQTSNQHMDVDKENSLVNIEIPHENPSVNMNIPGTPPIPPHLQQVFASASNTVPIQSIDVSQVPVVTSISTESETNVATNVPNALVSSSSSSSATSRLLSMTGGATRVLLSKQSNSSQATGNKQTSDQTTGTNMTTSTTAATAMPPIKSLLAAQATRVAQADRERERDEARARIRQQLEASKAAAAAATTTTSNTSSASASTTNPPQKQGSLMTLGGSGGAAAAAAEIGSAKQRALAAYTTATGISTSSGQVVSNTQVAASTVTNQTTSSSSLAIENTSTTRPPITTAVSRSGTPQTSSAMSSTSTISRVGGTGLVSAGVGPRTNHTTTVATSGVIAVPLPGLAGASTVPKTSTIGRTGPTLHVNGKVVTNVTPIAANTISRNVVPTSSAVATVNATPVSEQQVVSSTASLVPDASLAGKVNTTPLPKVLPSISSVNQVQGTTSTTSSTSRPLITQVQATTAQLSSIKESSSSVTPVTTSVPSHSALKPTNNISPASMMLGAKPVGALVNADENNYPMSDRGESSDDDGEDENGNGKKVVPEWAFGTALASAIHAQFGGGGIDPDTVFPEVSTCDLEEIFGAKKKRFTRRTSSGNWHQDRITREERTQYRNEMGFATSKNVDSK